MRRPGFDRPYTPGWKIWLPLLAFFLVADLTFDTWFWRIPKLTGTNADYGYQFLIDALPLRSAPQQGTARVVAFGSSVAGSFDPLQVASLLHAQDSERAVEVHRLLLPAAHPFDFDLYFRDARTPPADVVVVLFNLVDFLFSEGDRDINPTLRFVLPPFANLRAKRGTLGIADQLDLLVAGASDMYRYRRPLRSSLQDHVRALARWARRPADAAVYGIHADGYTARRFGLGTAADGSLRLRYHIEPDWLAQRGAVVLTFFADGVQIGERRRVEAGWDEIELQRQGAGRIDVVIDGLWSPRAAGADDLRLLGVRLDPQLVPAGGAGAAAPFSRRPRQAADIDTFLRMDGERDAAYLRRWDETLNADTRFGQRFRVYRDAKRAVRERAFRVDAEYAAVRALVQRFAEQGSRVVLVNSPESPLSLREYGDSAYYADYLRYFAEVAAETPGAEFVDFSTALPAEDFNDLHHPNFVGTIKLGPRYAQIVAAALSRAPLANRAAVPARP